ncbi:NfeD family protein [Aquabacterium sp.]|uniref:NfeD family protein n=1 Tax=Aquabacterium sp. TaxID=1872578 RepID=UPI002C5857C1|nr:NfeD family protein [Aquabacterium sp.]HSW09198.1 NfeD family protein [Aquabacterium sp.]
MDWNASTWWWLGTVALVAAELATGTFYLLMLAVGTAAAALAAHAGLSSTGQLVIGALVGSGVVALWYWRRSKQSTNGATDPALNLDIGGSVQVSHWHPDGSARVYYRGAGWDARYAGEGTPAPGEHVIRAVQGSRLLLDRPAP